MSAPDTVATGETKVTPPKSRTTIPKPVREAAGIDEGDTVKWVYQDGEIRVYKKD
jgi:AbrB family looped-hinge helix DNA binding protein